MTSRTMERRVERLETGAGIGPVTLRDMLIALNQLQSCEAGTAPAGYTADDAARDYEMLKRAEQDPEWRELFREVEQAE